jgi:hypothetical protein
VKAAGNFSATVQTLLAGTRVRDLLALSSAVVLERIAGGGGATNWYYCSGPEALGTVEAKLSPGSLVSFYFDRRIAWSRLSPQLTAAIEQIITESGDAVVGVLGNDGVEVNTAIVVSGDDLAEYMSTIAPTSQVLYGAFPSRDNDGTRALTVTLPDVDGVVRSHPH